MKILPIEKVREADQYTIENEPLKSIDLMERAASGCFKRIKKIVDKRRKTWVVCGPGNNGGDGLVIARLLAESKYNVTAVILKFSSKFSDDFSINYNRLKEIKNIDIKEVAKPGEMPEVGHQDFVVDAIFGSGLSKPVRGDYRDVIEHINDSGSTVIAVDIPSGLFADKHSDLKKNTIIRADHTFSFQFPKLAFFFAENEDAVGRWEVVPIGLHPDFINTVDVENHYVGKKEVSREIRQRKKFAHKGHFGHALLISGTYGKMGAAVLGARACLRTGAGLVTTHIPKCGYNIIQTAVPEAMTSIDEDEHVFSGQVDASDYNAIAIGPGIGKDEKTAKALKLLIQDARMPLLFDADAINILGENRTWLSFLPKNCIFTPHPKEFERISEKPKNDFHRKELLREFSVKYHAYVVLKGAYTAVSCPDGSCFFNSTGNPGMATAGSGDVLTGIILGLLAQNYHPKTASILGVYFHGFAADLALKKTGQQALIAGDIIEHLGKGYRKLMKESLRHGRW